MYRLLLAAAIAVAAGARQPVFEIAGSLEPRTAASVSIYGADAPFAEATLADAAGHFHFAHLAAGTYTIAVLAPGLGEARVTVEAGPGTADAKGRIAVKLAIPGAGKIDLARRHSVATAELSIPDRARREYEEAQKSLARRDAGAARAHLENAVAIAPQFATAWNNLGTIAYQSGEFERAADCFRRALAANPAAYEPLVNLGGVLINLNRFEEARAYNQHAVLLRPDDALANSQLGITFFEMGNYASAEKYLEHACELDPAHFSHPQLVLAEIHIRKNQRALAAGDLEHYLKAHPDAPNAHELRKDIAALRQ